MTGGHRGGSSGIRTSSPSSRWISTTPGTGRSGDLPPRKGFGIRFTTDDTDQAHTSLSATGVDTHGRLVRVCALRVRGSAVIGFGRSGFWLGSRIELVGAVSEFLGVGLSGLCVALSIRSFSSKFFRIDFGLFGICTRARSFGFVFLR